MAISHKVKVAIKGSIANPEAAEKVIKSLDSAAEVEALEQEVSELSEETEKAQTALSAAAALAPLAEGATLPEVVAKINALIAALGAE